MTVHDLHDALNLLPGDLITAADKLRSTSKPQIIPWKRIIPMAACLVLVLSAAMVFREMGLSKAADQKAAAPEAPAAAAPMAPENGMITEIPAEEAAPEAPAMDAAGSSAAQAARDPGAEEELCIDHSHRFAEEKEEDQPVAGYCGNMMTTIYLEDAEYSFAGSDSIAITDILVNLEYDPDAVCRCMAEFTVDTEMLAGIEVNLAEGFARCEQGQAALTEKQVQTIQRIIDSLT